MAYSSDSPLFEMLFLMKLIEDISANYYNRSDLLNNEEIRSVNSALNRILVDILSQIEKNKLQTPMENGDDNCDDK